MEAPIKILKSRSCRAAGILIFIATLGIGRAYADFATQLVPFFFPDGTMVVSATGEPDDAVLNRFFDTQKERINWQFMTQYLEPGESYDIWLEGSNDGVDHFVWWVGRVKANARGNLNGIGTVYAGVPLGPASGSFTNPRAAANLVIRTRDGVTVQTAYFTEY